MRYFRARIAGWSDEELLAKLRHFYSDTLLSPGGLARMIDEMLFACEERGLRERAYAIISECNTAERTRQREQMERVRMLGRGTGVAEKITGSNSTQET